jgi:hypothetical protein
VPGPVLLSLVVAALVGAGCAGRQDRSRDTAPAPAPFTAPNRPSASAGDDRTDRWREDLHVLATELPRRHKNLFARISRREFNRAVAGLSADIPSLADHEIIVRMAAIVASVGDGHTRLGGISRFPTVPIRLARFTDGVFVIATAKDQHSALGSQVMQIEDVPVAEALNAVSAVIPHDNQEQLFEQAPAFLVIPKVLHGLGVTRDPDRLTFALRRPDGTTASLTLTAVAPDANVHWVRAPADGAAPPLFLTDRDKPYWFRYLPDRSALYIAYNSCVDWKERPFRDFAAQVLEVIEATSPGHVIIDLRNNSGGNSRVIDPLVHGMKQMRRRRPDLGVVVLIGRYTYSSALLNAVKLQRQTKATLVGQPTGQKPNAYGEVRSFELPHSRLRVGYSTKYFRLFWLSDPPALPPDILVEPTSEDFFSGRDPVLDAVFVPPGES